MSLVIPDAVELEVLTDLVTPALEMRLYGNNKTPAHGDTIAGYTQIAGGGYAAKALTFANWTLTAGEPTVAVYNAVQQWTFTGIIDAPGTIYGYYIVRVADSFLLAAERFPSAIVPFSPIEGSIIKVLPKLSAQSQF
jgi:hypothetical protein